MDTVLLLLGTAARLIIRIYMLLLLIRALLPFLTFIDEDGAVYTFVYTSTEVILIPMRTLLDRFGIGEGLPVDISFIVTYVLLSVVHTLLTMV